MKITRMPGPLGAIVKGSNADGERRFLYRVSTTGVPPAFAGQDPSLVTTSSQTSSAMS
jgi:hypothetical protein